MKLRTSVKIASLITVCVFLAYAAALFYMDRALSHLAQEVHNANELSTRISLLRTLSLENLIYQTERSKRQWGAVYDEVRHLLADKVYLDLQLEYGLGDIGDKVKIVGDTFQNLLAMPGGERPDDPEAEVGPQLRNRLTTQLMLTTQDLLNQFANLREEINQRLIFAQRLSSLLDILVVLSLGLLIIGGGIFLQRSVLQPILRLHEGAEIVGAGNLDYKVGLDTPNELGELSRTFDGMIVNLQKVTVSRDELAREMAERRQAEEALRESEERFRTMANAIPQLAWIAENDGFIFWYNQRWYDYTGTTPEDMKGWGWKSVHDPKALPEVLEKWRGSIATGKPFDMIFPLRGADGQFRQFLTQVLPLKDASGQVVKWFGTNTDVTERQRTEEVLRESEERFRKVFENAATGIAITDWQGRFQQCNPAYCTLLGYTEEELRQLEFPALIHPEDRDQNLEKIQKLRAGELPFFEIENRYVRKDGQTVWVHKFVSILPDSTGKPAHIVALVTDITGRRRAEAKLAETLRQKEEALALSERLASFPRLNPNPVLEFDTQGGITYANEAAEKVLEQLAPDVSLRDFLPADWEEIQQACRDRGEKNFQREVSIKDKVFQETIYFSDLFDVWRIYTIDISQRHLAEAALRESEARFRTLFENMAEGVVIHELIYDENGRTTDYRIVSANPAFEKHTGLLAADIQGQLASRAYGLSEAPYLEVYARVAQTGEPTSFETLFPPLQRYFHISVTSPKKDYFVTVFEDITERRQMEERLRAQAIELSQAVSDLEEINAELERFMYMISHDLKSPLVTIATFLGYLEEDLEHRDASRIDKDIFYIRTAADKMGQLLSELLEMSRIGRLVNPSVEVGFQEVAREAVQTVAGPIAARGVAVQVGEENVPLYGDRPRLVEIWQNLLENAVKYMGEQPAPRLTIGLERQGEETVFFVCDNGIGIDPQYHDKIFGIFEKLDPKSGGTGIGLAIVKRIVELYRGKIWVESAGSGQGACFRFTLPAAVKGEPAKIE